jgi:RNA polymerase subunit RPABC4/transcription elongation factor Spt4
MLNTLTADDKVFCPKCGGSNISTYLVEWSATSKDDHTNHAGLDEHQCRDCGGVSFWT